MRTSPRFVLLALAALGCSDDASPSPDGGAPCPTAEAFPIETCPEVIGESHVCEGQTHVGEGEATWQTNPPSSGPHYPVWERVRGEHTEPVDRGNWVHNLEHGWVVLAYNCPDGCETELGVLRALIAERPLARIILTPDPLLDAPRFAAVSWTWIYETDAPDLDTLVCFVDQHEGQAPEDIP